MNIGAEAGGTEESGGNGRAGAKQVSRKDNILKKKNLVVLRCSEAAVRYQPMIPFRAVKRGLMMGL
jgi:hypothetical protein